MKHQTDKVYTGPLSSDKGVQEKFVNDIIDILRSLQPIRLELDVVMVPENYINGGNFRLYLEENYILRFKRVDQIDFDLYVAFNSRFGAFLELNGYRHNPIVSGVLAILHECGHIVYNHKMMIQGMFDNYMNNRQALNSVIDNTITVQEEDKMQDNGFQYRYLLSGDEMYSDAFAITYFPRVIQLAVEKGIITLDMLDVELSDK